MSALAFRFPATSAVDARDRLTRIFEECLDDAARLLRRGAISEPAALGEGRIPPLRIGALGGVRDLADDRASPEVVALARDLYKARVAAESA